MSESDRSSSVRSNSIANGDGAMSAKQVSIAASGADDNLPRDAVVIDVDYEQSRIPPIAAVGTGTAAVANGIDIGSVANSADSIAAAGNVERDEDLDAAVNVENVIPDLELAEDYSSGEESAI